MGWLALTEILRRILWSLPVFVAASVALFFVLGNTHPMQEHLTRPLFYNPNPLSAETAARKALRRVIAPGGHDSSAADLVELGGAALPTLLPQLPALTVAEQRRLAEALWPVAQRMNLLELQSWSGVSAGERVEPTTDEKLLFWERYREEHALDLRPQAVSRLVRRVAEQRGNLRGADLDAIDTYSLPTLVDSLGRVSSADDVQRCASLISRIAHVTGRPFALSRSASPIEAQRVVTRVRWFWDDEGPRWTSLNRFELLVARFSQTEFATWIARMVRQATRLDEPVTFQPALQGARVSAPLMLAALIGLMLLGPSAAATVQVIQLRETKWRLERLGLRAGLAALVVTLVPLVVEKRSSGTAELWGICVLLGTALSAFTLQRELSDRLDWRTHHVLRNRRLVGRISAVGRWLGPSLPTILPIAVAEATLWITALEVATETAGLGLTSVSAAQSGDLYLLMVTCLTVGVTVGAALLVSDVLAGTPRAAQGET